MLFACCIFKTTSPGVQGVPCSSHACRRATLLGYLGQPWVLSVTTSMSVALALWLCSSPGLGFIPSSTNLCFLAVASSLLWGGYKSGEAVIGSDPSSIGFFNSHAPSLAKICRLMPLSSWKMHILGSWHLLWEEKRYGPNLLHPVPVNTRPWCQDCWIVAGFQVG